jgi:hypothetical protein
MPDSPQAKAVAPQKGDNNKKTSPCPDHVIEQEDMPMTDLDARAQHIKAVVEGHQGTIIKCDGEHLIFELPADIAPGLAAVWGQSGILPIFQGQRTRLAACRVTDANGNVIVCPDIPVTTVFFRYNVDLTIDTRSARSAAAIMAQTKPFKG